MVERKNSRRQIEEIQAQINRISSNVDIKEYMEKSGPLLRMYSEMGHQPKIVSFKETQETLPDKKSKHNPKQIIIAKYLEIARQYIDIDLIQDMGDIEGCLGCGTLEEAVVDEISFLSYCPNCGVERNIICHTTLNNNSNSNQGPKNNYNDRDNFLKAIKRMQGKQLDRIPNELYAALDRYFANYGLPTSEEIRKRPLNAYGLREGTNREMLFKALADIGKSAYYEDANLIGHNYWGWKLLDISHLEDSLMDDYDASQRVFERLKTGRKSCLNVQYRLWKLIQKHADEGIPCREEDFKIITTRDTIEYHDEMWEQICRELGWKFIKTI